MPIGNLPLVGCSTMCWGRRFQRTPLFGREKAVLINILLDIELAELFRVASRCSGISERRIWCYVHEIMFDLIKHGGSCIVSPLL